MAQRREELKLNVSKTAHGKVNLLWHRAGQIAFTLQIEEHEAIAIALGVLRVAAPVLADRVEAEGLALARIKGANIVDQRGAGR